MLREEHAAFICVCTKQPEGWLQINVMCSDRGLVSQRIEELENPTVKRFLVGFARTSDSNGPAMPLPLSGPIEESEVRARLIHPLLGIPFRIFGSAPPLQSFDFAKMLTVSIRMWYERKCWFSSGNTIFLCSGNALITMTIRCCFWDVWDDTSTSSCNCVVYLTKLRFSSNPEGNCPFDEDNLFAHFM